MADSQPTATNPPAASAAALPVTLSALAATLGELEPRDPVDDLRDDHMRRWTALFHAATALQVLSPADAMHALSATASFLTDAEIGLDEVPPSREVVAAIRHAQMTNANVARWLVATFAVMPIRAAWPHSYATPLPDYQEPQRKPA